MSLPSITPTEARRRVDRGALLVDIREAGEHAREHIPGARLMPLSALEGTDLAPDKGQQVVFHCQSGARTRAHAARLAGKAGAGQAFILEGGLSDWKRAGLPTVLGQGGPVASREQLPIVAGIVGVVLGVLVSPWFFAVPVAVAAGLMAIRLAGSRGAGRGASRRQGA